MVFLKVIYLSFYIHQYILPSIHLSIYIYIYPISKHCYPISFVQQIKRPETYDNIISKVKGGASKAASKSSEIAGKAKEKISKNPS